MRASTLCRSRLWLAGVFGLATACSSTPAQPPQSAGPGPRAEPAAAARKSRSNTTPAADSPAEWNILVEGGEVWARPELDRFCQSSERAYYVHTIPTSSYDKPPAPEGAGCRPRFGGTAVEVGKADPPCGAAEVPGRTYCCPSALLAPPPPISGGGATCEQVELEYLSEMGVDPLVTRSQFAGPSGPTFDRSGKVLGRGRYLDACQLGASTQVEICAAVRDGQAQGVTLCMQPADPEVGHCIAQAIRQLKFPEHKRLDVTLTAFDPR